MDELTWLQHWYEQQCDEEWEHEFGVTIDTLDNPGWMVKVDLKGTALADQPDALLLHDGIDRDSNESGNDWTTCSIESGQFKGYGGPQKLITILRCFREWAERVQPAAA